MITLTLLLILTIINIVLAIVLIASFILFIAISIIVICAPIVALIVSIILISKDEDRIALKEKKKANKITYIPIDNESVADIQA